MVLSFFTVESPRMDSSEYRWRRLFVAALTERDFEKFTSRLTLADDAIFDRLLEAEHMSEPYLSDIR
jgi:hypothetical protein